MLPGFINTHVHNAFRESNLRKWASEGVTTVRDVGAAESPSVAFAIRDSMHSNPYCARVVAAGPLVTVPGGYPIVPNNFPALVVNSAEDARMKIRQLLDQGAELIKITLDSSYGSPTLSSEEVNAIVETAHERGRPVTSHMARLIFLQWALNAGVDDTAHSIVDSIPDEWIDRMIRGKMSLVPTLMAQRKTGASLQNLRRFVAAGGRVALGNDGGYIAGMEIGMPITEIEAMQEAGMTPMQIIVAATKNAAEVCRLEHVIGSLEFGKEADILVVKRNPLTDLRALLEVEHVFHRGVMIR
jgi:imidazolonepropionase-like amidohydrolase